LFYEIANHIFTEFLQNKISGNILEIGCGNGLILKALNNLLNNNLWKLFGSDISGEMLRRMDENDFVLYHCDASRIPCSDCQFDLIYAHSVIQYFDNEEYFENVLAECLRILRPGGGIFLMDVPFIWYKEYMLKNNFKSKIKRWIAKKARTQLPIAYNIYKKSRVEGRIEKVAGIQISTPVFRGFWVNPDYLYKYNRYFGRVAIEVQPYFYKPVRYRKFRFNILMMERNELIFKRDEL
jgi:SAM-dependent methyltransferase